MGQTVQGTSNLVRVLPYRLLVGDELFCRMAGRAAALRHDRRRARWCLRTTGAIGTARFNH